MRGSKQRPARADFGRVGAVAHNEGVDDDLQPRDRGEHPVLSGVIALVGVAVVVGLILGGGALAATKVLGVDGETTSADDASASETLYLPPRERTGESTGPYITLAPGATEAPGSGLPSVPATPTKHADTITLSAGQTAVGQMEPIDLSGTYPGGEGSILQVQQYQNGAWADFPVTIPVDGDSFSTFIQASAIGPNRFRVVDTDTDLASNEIRVKIG